MTYPLTVPTCLVLCGLLLAGCSDDDGAGWFGTDKATLLREAALEACDALDGLADGLISNRQACAFDSSVLLCEAGEDEADCYTAAQIDTVDLMQSRIDLPYTLANGVNSFPGFDIGGDWSGATNTGTTAELNLPPSIPELGAAHWFGDGLVRWLLLADENADTLAFDPQNPGDLLPRVQELSELLDHASTDIQAYLDQGGKLMLMHGQSDSLVNTQPTVEYYNDLVTRYGQTTIDQAIRFYLVPGFGHGSGLSFTPAMLTEALFAALDQWVSGNVEPTPITMTDLNPDTAGRTRPLCQFPSFAQYDGTGDPSLAGSFACRETTSLNQE